MDSFLLFWDKKGTTNNREMGGALVLDGRHLTGKRNNQPNDSVGSGGGALERRCAQAERVGDCILPVNFDSYSSDEK